MKIIILFLFLIALSENEMHLFRELIRDVEAKIQPGIKKLTWNSEYIEEYIKNCNSNTANVSNHVRLDTYDFHRR